MCFSFPTDDLEVNAWLSQQALPLVMTTHLFYLTGNLRRNPSFYLTGNVFFLTPPSPHPHPATGYGDV